MEALAKGLRILSLFDEQRPTWRVSDLATAAGLPMPTVYRVVMTLASEGYLDHLPNGDYRPGVRTLTLGTAALRSLDLVAIATPKLTELGERTGETVNLAVLSGDRVLYLIRLRNSDLVTANIQVGSTLPAVHTSIGKLLLAYLDEADLAARITDASFSANSGPNAKVSLAELREELRTIRDQGWAMQDEELAYGLRSVAGPITSPDGRVLAGVNVAVQARDWSTQRIIRELRPDVLATCAEISGLLSDTSAGTAVTSGARIPKLEPSALDDDQRSLYDAIAGGRRAQGPQLFRLADAAGAARRPVQRLPAAAAAGVGAAGARLLGALRHRARRPVPGDRDPGGRRALAVRLRVVRPRGGRPLGRPGRRRAGRRAGRAATPRWPGARPWSRARSPRWWRGATSTTPSTARRSAARRGRAVRAAHPGRLLRHARPPAPRVPGPGPGRHRPGRHRPGRHRPGRHRARLTPRPPAPNDWTKATFV